MIRKVSNRMNIFNKRISNKLLAHIALYLATFIWGTSFLFTKIILLAHIPPVITAVIRFSLASAILVVYLIFIKKEKISLPKREILYLFLLGSTGISIYYWAENTSLLTITTAGSSLICALVPGITLILSMIFLGEKANKIKLLGLLISFIGVSIIILKGISILEVFKINIGYIYAFISTLSFSAFNIISKKVMITRSSVQTTTFTFLFGIILLIPQALNESRNMTILSLTPMVIFGMLYLVILCSIVAYFLWNLGLKHMEAGGGSVYMNNVPLVSVILGWLFLGETITINIVVGGLLILGGIFLVSYNSGVEDSVVEEVVNITS